MKEAKLFIARYRGLTTIYRLAEAYSFRDHRARRHVAPAGFETDGASFPWWLRYLPGLLMFAWLVAHLWIVGPIETNDLMRAFLWSTAAQAFVGYPIHKAYTDAGVAHDYLYSIGFPKLRADLVFFLHIAERANVLRLQAIAGNLSRSRIHLALRCGFAHLIYVYRVLRACTMFFAVALLGWPAYWAHSRNRKRKVAEWRSKGRR